MGNRRYYPRKDEKMKHFKKVMALLLAMVMVLAMGTTALAVTPAIDKNTEEDGSVTVNSPKVGQTYTLFMLFEADMGANDAITYTLPAGKTEADLTYTDGEGHEHHWFKLNSNGFVVAEDGVVEDWAKDPNAIAWARSFGTQTRSPIVAGEVKWTGLKYGYYFVDTSLGAFIGVDSANKDAVISEKNEEPKVDKSITGVEGEDTTLGTGDDTTDPGRGVHEKAIAQVGDTVSYTVVIKAKPGAENYSVTDEMTNLNLKADTLKVDGDVYTESDKVDQTKSSAETNKYTIVFKQAYLDTITEATDITITYDAVLTGKSVIIGQNGNENTATLTYGHQEENTTTDSAKVYTAQISVIKHDDQSTGLANAEFALKNSEGKYYKVNTENGEVTWVDTVADATKYTSGADGNLNGIFTGLSNDVYVLEETVVPDGYNKIDPTDRSLIVTIADDDYSDDNLKQERAVINHKGTELPSTGGIGTTIFYVVGAVLVIGAGVLLVSRRRMR